MSYRVLEREKLYDARNIFDNKGVTETRHGIKRFNSTSVGGAILSVTYFKKASGTRYRIAKVSGTLYAVTATGAATAIKTGLAASAKHRGITLNDRHIIAVEGENLLSFDGTTCTQLGQEPPSTPTVGAASGGSLTDTAKYRIALTFYSSTTGFESNYVESAEVTMATPNLQIDVTAIQATAANATIDAVRVYLKNVTTGTAYLFSKEISLGVTSTSVTIPSTSTVTPPTTHGFPPSGGGKYLAVYGNRLVVSGNPTFANDVYQSEDYLPDAFDDTATSKTISIDGQGPVTGLGVGLYSDSHLNPFLVAFKKTSTTIYSELGGSAAQAAIDEHLGCISHDTIKVRNGVIYFMSENGWYPIQDGVIRRKDGTPQSLGNGDIDDIFSRTGWSYELNASNYDQFFSVYYPTLGHYLTFISEGGNSVVKKAYCYEERIGGFRAYQFKTAFTSATEGEDDDGYQCVYLADADGYLYTHSTRNDRHDEDSSGASQSIPAFFYSPFVVPGDDSCSYNFRELILRAISSDNDITVRAFPSFSLFSGETTEFDFSNAQSGFVLDLSQLDVDVLGDERVPTTYMADINRTGEAMIIGFFQDIADASMGLISAQLQFNKNGNRNL